MLRTLLPVRLLVTLALVSGGAMAVKQPTVRGLLPPSVAQAVELIDDKQAELVAAFR
jgi:hypothetical protein